MEPFTLTHQDWFLVTESSPGVFAIREPVADEDVLSFLVVGEESALLIDTGYGVGSMRAVVESFTDLPVVAVNSHAHWDHIGNNREFPDIAIHRDCQPMLGESRHGELLREACAPARLRGALPEGVQLEDLDIVGSQSKHLLDGGETFDLGGRMFEAINATGHAEGLLVFLDRANGVLLSTDVAYPAALYAHLDGSNFDDYRTTMQMLADLAPSLNYVHPSHNADQMPPEMLIAMRDALESIAAGRPADRTIDRGVQHVFDGFSVLVPADLSKV